MWFVQLTHFSSFYLLLSLPFPFTITFAFFYYFIDVLKSFVLSFLLFSFLSFSHSLSLSFSLFFFLFLSLLLPLHVGRDVSWCQQLVSNGANPNLSNHDGWHPIHLAAFNGLHESLTYLITCNSKAFNEE